MMRMAEDSDRRFEGELAGYATVHVANSVLDEEFGRSGTVSSPMRESQELRIELQTLQEHVAACGNYAVALFGCLCE